MGWGMVLNTTVENAYALDYRFDALFVVFCLHMYTTICISTLLTSCVRFGTNLKHHERYLPPIAGTNLEKF